jgi:hypothetical protein
MRNNTDAPRYLTKSRFKTGLECPAKLFYIGKPEFANSRSDDAFMRALAEGGFQVGELAKLMYPGGVEVSAPGHEEALAETAALLLRDEVTIFEAAVRFGSLFVRVDVLKKRGRHLELIEVKARSYDRNEPHFFASKEGRIKPAILPYLQDVAFQKLVVSQAFPDHTVSTYLMMPDKAAVATVDQLNQRFKIRRTRGRNPVDVAPGTTADSIGARLLAAVPVSAYVDQIIDGEVETGAGMVPFRELVERFAMSYERDEKIPAPIGAHCARCEFRASEPGPDSGFHACWTEVTGWRDADFAGGTVLDLWNFRGKDALIRKGIFKLAQVSELDLAVKPGERGLSRSERQWMQASGQCPGGAEFYLDGKGLRDEVSSWCYPLHFIDFETSRMAVPFHQGRRPYEQVAFQFSHHVLTEDGRVEHRSQFLEAAPGVFPNYAFARELRRQLSGDQGTILRWATHENSVLRDIWTQLENDPEAPSDKDELQAFILSITSDGARVGARTMVDLCKMAERYYFHPLTKGSCSIKKVLPAVLSSSPFLRERYGGKVYGSRDGIPSLNFQDWAWWQASVDSALPRDPYTLLPAVFEGVDALDAADLDENEGLANGGAAMAAYARLQFEQISDNERRRLTSALLKYCELDTLAMVMIFQAWQAAIDNNGIDET